MAAIDRMKAGRAGRLARWAAACAFALATLAAAVAHAGPAPGTVIPNQASATGSRGGQPISSASNFVTVTVGGGPQAGYAAVLQNGHTVNTLPGETVALMHTLTNVGTLPDTYTLSLTPLDTNGWPFDSAQFFRDANVDGRADAATPFYGPVALAPGQSYHFVAVYKVPASAPMRTRNTAWLRAASVGGAEIVPVADTLLLADTSIKPDCGAVTKALSHERGPSPAGPVTVTLTYTACDKARARVVISDRLPAGMRYVPGSGRWSGLPGAALTDAVEGADRQGSGSAQVAYDFNGTTAGAVTATVHGIPAQAGGWVSFDVEIEPGLAVGTTIPNQGDYVFYDAAGLYMGLVQTNVATYRVDGRIGFELTGERLPTVAPGSTVSFTNVLHNRGDYADTFDITLAGSTFPAGTTFALFKPDGVTPLADTDGNGTPDTGVVPAGGSYRIVVRTRIPETAAPAAYKVTKTARSAAWPRRTASADDAVDTVSLRCAVTLEPDQSARVGYGQRVTYTHHLANTGNCRETLRALPEHLADSRPGWRSAVYVDNPVAGGGSVPGVLDRTDRAVAAGWGTTLEPAQAMRLLVEVVAPTAEALAAASKSAKAVMDSNVTTLVLSGAASGAVRVRDTTVVEDKSDAGEPQNVIRNFTDASYAAPTAWGVVGGALWLRADAASCNAVADVVESRRVVITGPGGEREEVLATETGPDTGIFVVAAMPVRAPPAVAGDGTVQGRADDVFDFEIVGCGRRIANVVTLMEPRGVVFDSRSNEPVQGARVTLVAASGGRCGASPVALASGGNPAVTGGDGAFAFPPLPAGEYCLAVGAPNGYRFPSQVAWPMLPDGRNLHVTGLTSGGSYGGAFSLAAGALLAVDLPVDGAAQDGLFVRKEASRAAVEVGEFVDYAVRVRNGTGNALDRAQLSLEDALPQGFAYVAGSARRDGRAAADPAGGAGPRLAFALGALGAGEEATLTYRVRVGPGALQGDGVNRAQARYAAGGATTLSNVASARVQVTGGVFTDKGFILGKVFADCNANGVQDAGEPGVPGVRLVLEDGTFVLTDGLGKYSFYGIPNRTHVVKADRTTLPALARLAPISARHLGDGGSRIVDLKSGELHRADFAIAGCTPALRDEIRGRAEALAARADELGLMAAAPLATEPLPVSDRRALPASGIVAVAAPGGANGANAAVGTQPSPKGEGAQRLSPSPLGEGRGEGRMSPPADLEQLVPQLDNALGFVGLADGDTLPYAQSAVRVKGRLGAAFTLTLNGEPVSEKLVGKRATLEDKQVQAWEFIGVDFRAGENTLTLAQRDPFGNERGKQSIRVVAPGKLARVVVEVPGASVADGRSVARLVVRLQDAAGTPVTVRTPVTLEASRGTWQTADLDPAEPGLQVMVEGGRGEVALVAPTEPGEARVVAASGPFKAEAPVDFLPELRRLIAAGVVEGIVNVRRLGASALVPARDGDGFERELRHLSRSSSDGRVEAGARAAFFLKGKIRGEYLLTAAYDSEKDTRERLFRDIQPDEFYPVYGDAAVRGYDAQSTSRLYLRVDHRKSYLLYGDFTTQGDANVRRLSAYSRSLTGMKHHYEGGRVQANVFASRDTTRQVIDEVRANGTSGPYTLSSAAGLVNSEKVEILTRDRNRPALVISAVAQARFYDYEMEPLTGRLLFKAPVPSVDADLNPVSIRITYEVDQGGEQFWVFGGDASVKVTDAIEVGGSFAEDRNPAAPFRLRGAHALVRLGSRTHVAAEFARTEREGGLGTGDAARVHVKHDGERLKAEAFVARTDPEFDNPGAYLGQGRGEAGARATYKIDDATHVKAEALRTEDRNTGSVRDGFMVSAERAFDNRMKVELGVRHAREEGAGAVPATVAGPGSAGTTPNEVTSVRARVTGPMPFVAKDTDAAVYGEVEVDVRDAERKVVALGGHYALDKRGKVYFRHELMSSLTGPYGLNEPQRQNATILGVDTEYMKDARLFSEYRLRDALSGGDAEAAIGLRNLWTLAEGLRLGTTFERVHAISGTGQNENAAVALALEYTANPLWKGSTRLELRDAATSQSLLHTVGVASRVSPEWTLLGRNTLSIQRNKGGERDGTERVLERLQAGVAFRDAATDRVNALARIEHREERDDTQPGMALKRSTELVSVHADWKPIRPFVFTGHYAAKWTRESANGVASRYRAQLASARATWEFAPRWDVSLAASGLFGERAASRQYALGLEVGYLVATNLWVSAGYNVLGYHDEDLAAGEYTRKGAYVRLRYKFDEALLGQAGEAAR